MRLIIFPVNGSSVQYSYNSSRSPVLRAGLTGHTLSPGVVQRAGPSKAGAPPAPAEEEQKIVPE